VTLPRRARLVRVPLEGGPAAADAALLVRGDAHPFALVGAWAGGGALVGSEPVEVAPDDADPFVLVDRQPEVVSAGERPAAAAAGERPDAVAPGDGAVGGGWFGFLGYGLGSRLEALPPSPPRPAPLPRFSLGFYDHLLHLDPAGRWWFEALWSEERDSVLRERLQLLRARLSAGVVDRPVRVGAFSPVAPGGAGHLAAVAQCRERIAAGEIFQANLCLRLESRFGGDPLDLFARAARSLHPRYGALIAGRWGAVCSMSPELFLRRRDREVVSEPIKGTAARAEGAGAGATRDPIASRAALAASAKDRAENVMIVDLMRNDLGRVCEYGSVSVPALSEPRPAPGVWHLVSTVSGTLRPEVGDGDLLRASFPPGSVTGAPKIQTMRVIAELESTAREAYTGAIGYASPVAGLELNVAIRTLELRGDRIWLGAGGGIVADSDPEAELEEALLKGRPVVEAAGGRLEAAGRRLDAAEGRPDAAEGRPDAAGQRLEAAGPEAAPRRLRAATVRPRAPRPAPFALALAAGADRPDPALGVFSTMLVRDGRVVDLHAHLTRLRESVRELYGRGLSGSVQPQVEAAGASHRLARLRISVDPAAAAEVEVHALDGRPSAAPLAPVTLPGGLGAHKWRDRRLLDELERRLGAVPLLVDLDGEVLEAAHANVWIVEGDVLITPPLDGRLLPGTVRGWLLAEPPAGLEAREEPIPLDRLAASDEILLTSSIRGLHPATLPGAKPARFEAEATEHRAPAVAGSARRP
jgi:para-aminobenzoate synthetase / 4-amino-4-deoxychorismate lyase